MFRVALHVLALAGVAVLLGLALAGDQGRLAILKMEDERSHLEEEIRAMEAENQQLELMIEQMRRPEATTEQAARETYGFLRGDEIVFVEP